MFTVLITIRKICIFYPDASNPHHDGGRHMDLFRTVLIHFDRNTGGLEGVSIYAGIGTSNLHVVESLVVDMTQAVALHEQVELDVVSAKIQKALLISM